MKRKVEAVEDRGESDYSTGEGASSRRLGAIGRCMSDLMGGIEEGANREKNGGTSDEIPVFSLTYQR